MIVKTILKNGIVVYSSSPMEIPENYVSATGEVSLGDVLNDLLGTPEATHEPYPVKDEMEYAAIMNSDHEDFETMKRGGWEQDGKYQYCENIVRHKGTGLHYSVCMARSGSPFTDWHYEHTDDPLTPVVCRLKVEEVWS